MDWASEWTEVQAQVDSTVDAFEDDGDPDKW
jgi:hypothetical protein